MIQELASNQYRIVAVLEKNSLQFHGIFIILKPSVNQSKAVLLVKPKFKAKF